MIPSSFITPPLRLSFSPGFWVTSPFARQSNLTPLFPLTFFLFVHYFSSSCGISPLRSSFLLFVHHVSSSFIISFLRSSFLLFVHHFSSSHIIFLFVHHFSSSFIVSPLRSSFLLCVHHFSSSFIISPLRSSFLLFVHHCSSSFIMSPLRTSFVLFVHLLSLRSSIFLFGQVPPVTSAGLWVTSPFARQSNLTPLFPLTIFLFVHDFSSSFIISPLRSSFLLFVHHCSSSFIMSPLRTSFFLFVHSFFFAFINFPFRSSAAGHVGRVLGDFSFCTSIKFDAAVSAYSFPLRS